MHIHLNFYFSGSFITHVNEADLIDNGIVTTLAYLMSSWCDLPTCIWACLMTWDWSSLLQQDATATERSGSQVQPAWGANLLLQRYPFWKVKLHVQDVYSQKAEKSSVTWLSEVSWLYRLVSSAEHTVTELDSSTVVLATLGVPLGLGPRVQAWDNWCWLWR